MRRKNRIRKKRVKIRFNLLPFIAALLMIFIIYQPAFGHKMGGVSLGSTGSIQLDIVKNLVENPETIEFGKSLEYGGTTTTIYLMLISLIISIASFLLAAFGIRINNIDFKALGTIGAVSALIYAAFNYIVVSQANRSLGIFAALGGMSMSVPFYVAIVVGIGYFYIRSSY